MQKHLLPLILSLLLLASCGDNVVSSEESSTPISSEEITSVSSETISSSEEITSEEVTSISSEEVSFSEEESTSEESSTTVSSEEDSSEESSEEELDKVLLDCGYYQMDLPKNKDNPYELTTTLSADSTTWSNNYMYDELPTDFRFIYGNSCDDGETGHRASPSFYSYQENNASKYPGGLKFDQKSKGFQTQLFEHTGSKLEIRIGISQVNNCSDKYEAGKDTMGVYYFNKTGKYLGKHSIEEGTINTKTTQIKYYETSDFTSEIAYFEVRLIAMAYKGSQCYNLGISYCNFKSWERI